MNKTKIVSIVLWAPVLFIWIAASISQFNVSAAPVPFLNEGNAFGSAAILGTTDNFPLRIITNNTEKIRVLTNGNFGIGTASPASKLHVVGTGNITSNLTIGGTVNGLTLIAQPTGFTIAGGITSKTLTLSGDASVNQNLLTSSSPSFAGLILTGVLTASSSTGLSGQVLTSNGSSFAPSWTNVSSGNKRHWLGAGMGAFDIGSTQQDNEFDEYIAADASLRSISWAWAVPSDFNSLVSTYLWWESGANSGDIDISVYSRTVTDGENTGNGGSSDFIANLTDTTAGNGLINKLDITSALNGLSISAGDIIGIKVQRNGASANDTLDTLAFFKGVEINYEN